MKPFFSVKINGTDFSLAGTTKPFAHSRETIFDLQLTKLNIPEYLAYIPNPTEAKIKSGTLDLHTQFSYIDAPGDQHLSLSGLLSFKNLNLVNRQDDEYFAKFPQIDIQIAPTNLLKQEFMLESVSLPRPEVHITRQPDGQILPLVLFEKEEKASSSQAEGNSETSEPINFTVQTVDSAGGKVFFVDQGPRSPVSTQITDISLNLAHLSTAENSMSDISFALKLDDNGTFAGRGTLGISPLTSHLTLDGKDIALRSLQNYISDHLRILITDGALSTKGELDITKQEELAAHFNGTAKIADLNCTDSTGDDLLKWKDLALAGIQFSSEDHKLAVEKVSWDNLFLQLTVLEDGSLNLANIQVPNPESDNATKPPQQTEEESEPMDISIADFTLSGAKLNFQDRNISPSYAATLDDFSGTITGLSTNKESLAQVELQGKINRHAPVAVTGSINPLKEDFFADLKLDFHDIDLSSTSPYTGKYISYKTDKGKLTLNLHYTFNGKELAADNKVFLDQFTLGEFIDSPDAVSLPIHLAIALLKNRSGEIFLDIPISGNLNDPEFSVGSVVFKAIFNLIAKAATSPFALLGALIPDGEDLQYVSFEPGATDIDQNAADKLTQMALVLYERPGLRMDIQGAYTPDSDRQALAMARLQQRVRFQKVKEQIAAKTTQKKDAIHVSAAEYPHYLALAYQESLSQNAAQSKAASTDALKPPPSPADQKPLTVEFMEEELLKKITITDGDLRLLATQRAGNVLNFLVVKGPVEPERLFLIEPNIAHYEETGNNEPPQVELILK